MSGIYFHIPFCKQACHYCNFHFSTSLKLKDEMIEAMIKEIGLSKNTFGEKELETIETIYFGGGTPSLLNIEDLKKLISAVYEQYNISQHAEVTLEANPDDINKIKLDQLRLAGINRLSVGVQSFVDTDLIWMNRVHNSIQSRDSISMIKEAGFTNFSIDLIYGTPTLTDEQWLQNVQTVIELEIPHLSCYALTVEAQTPLQKMIIKKSKADIDNDKQASQFLMLMNWLNKEGYEHYEISNFAKPGFRSKHNSSYWQGKPYIGIGPSAHSFNGKIRRWNISNNALYIQSLKKDNILFEEEKLSETEQINEYIMTAVRTIEGIDLDFIKTKFGEEKTDKLQAASEKYINNHKLQTENHKLTLTSEGKLFADGIAADLFF